MNKPTDEKLYEKVKKEVYKEIKQHSAYRSGILVKRYVKEFEEKYKNKEAYIGKKPDKKVGLQRWFLEEWKNQRNEVGYKKEGDYYRPTKRITNKTPRLHKELSKEEKKKAYKLKKKGERASFM